MFISFFLVTNKFLDTNYGQQPTVPPPLRTSMGMEWTCPTLWWWWQGTTRGTKRTKNAQETLSTSLGPTGKSFLHVHFIFLVTNKFLDTNYGQPPTVPTTTNIYGNGMDTTNTAVAAGHDEGDSPTFVSGLN